MNGFLCFFLYTLYTEVSSSSKFPEGCESFYGQGLESFTAFSTPNYPSPYPPSLDCVRVVPARPGYDIIVKFDFFFQVESSYASSTRSSSPVHANCPNDFVEFRDGRYGFSPLIGRFCGMEVPKEEIRARSGYLWMRFHSDDLLEYKGFHASYEMVKSKEKTLKPEDCHAELTGSFDGILDSSTLPAVSAANSSQSLECVWRVEVPAPTSAALFIEQFQLTNPNNCDDNFVEVYAGTTGDRPLRRFCGMSASNLFATSSVLFVRLFVSRASFLSTTKVRAIYSSYARFKNCSALGMFTCGDENCLPLSLKCNGRPNCAYGTDEMTCSTARSGLLQFISAGPAPLVILVVLVAIVVIVIYLLTFQTSSCTETRPNTRSRRHLNGWLSSTGSPPLTACA